MNTRRRCKVAVLAGASLGMLHGVLSGRRGSAGVAALGAFWRVRDGGCLLCTLLLLLLVQPLSFLFLAGGSGNAISDVVQPLNEHCALENESSVRQIPSIQSLLPGCRLRVDVATVVGCTATQARGGRLAGQSVNVAHAEQIKKCCAQPAPAHAGNRPWEHMRIVRRGKQRVPTNRQLLTVPCRVHGEILCRVKTQCVAAHDADDASIAADVAVALHNVGE